MTAELLSRARAGDDDAFRDLTEPYRRELQVHCYRILGSVADAEDLLQEILLAAWRGLATEAISLAPGPCANAQLQWSTTGRHPNPPGGRRPFPAAGGVSTSDKAGGQNQCEDAEMTGGPDRAGQGRRRARLLAHHRRRARHINKYRPAI